MRCLSVTSAMSFFLSYEYECDGILHMSTDRQTDRPSCSSSKIPQFRGPEVRGHTAVLKSAETLSQDSVTTTAFDWIKIKCQKNDCGFIRLMCLLARTALTG